MTQLVYSCFLSLVLSTAWLALSVLARSSEALFLPQAIRFAVAALVLFIVPLIVRRRLPQISLRLFHAAITVGGLAYFLSPILCFYALRTLSSGFGALVYATLPMWFLLVAYQDLESRLPYYGIVIAGIVLFYLGVYSDNELRAATWLPLVCLIAGMICFMMGVWVSKRLFWLHSTLDLNFWSMLFAAVVHFFMAIVLNEGHLSLLWPNYYWTYLLYLAVIVTGLGSYLWRYHAGVSVVVAYSALVPLGALGVGWLMWAETPINILTIAGEVCVVFSLVQCARSSRPSRWMGLYVYNIERQGDRLMCLLDGEICGEDGEVRKFQMNELSMNGLGYRSPVQYAQNTIVTVSLPIGSDRSRVVVDCRVVYSFANPSKDYPWGGGLEFYKIHPDRRQSLIEFLARLTHAEER